MALTTGHDPGSSCASGAGAGQPTPDHPGPWHGHCSCVPLFQESGDVTLVALTHSHTHFPHLRLTCITLTSPLTSFWLALVHLAHFVWAHFGSCHAGMSHLFPSVSPCCATRPCRVDGAYPKLFQHKTRAAARAPDMVLFSFRWLRSDPGNWKPANPECRRDKQNQTKQAKTTDRWEYGSPRATTVTISVLVRHCRSGVRLVRDNRSSNRGYA